MKFSGEIKFPELDHPGVPIQFIIDGRQAELTVDGESLGRWSLYDIHARRLVASAFLIDLGGTEVTFVADDPIDFAYRGVEHMAETWAQMKAMQVGRRMVAVRKSRKDTLASRLDELRSAMEDNLEVQTRPLAGEGVMPATKAPVAIEPAPQSGDVEEAEEEVGIPPVSPIVPAEAGPAIDDGAFADERARLEEERLRVADERARLEEQRIAADQRETVRLEAYRLEMQRLEEEREELRRQLAQMSEVGEAAEAMPEPVVEQVEPVIEEAPAVAVTEDEVVSDVEVPAEDVEEEPAEEVEETPAGETPAEVFEDEPEPEEDGTLQPVDGAVLDLKGLEADAPPPEPEPGVAQPEPARQPAMAGAGRERGLMGAVKAAFARGGAREHEHRYIVAPGGMGIVRYVCEICGYVSISVND